MKIESRIVRPAAAGLAYATLVFGVGFVLGAIRVIVVVPRVGPTAAVLFETPLILGASWWLVRLGTKRFEISRAISARLIMGLSALGVLVLEELTLATLFFGSTVHQYISSLATVPGAIGVAGQVVFAAFPLLEARLVSP